MTLVKLISFQTVLSNRAKSFKSCVFLSRTLVGAYSSILEYAFVNSEFDMHAQIAWGITSFINITLVDNLKQAK